jgi:hypothetical protein
LGNVSHMAELGTHQENIKIEFTTLLNIELSPTHLESELDTLALARKLVKDVGHLWMQNFEKNKFYISL